MADNGVILKVDGVTKKFGGLTAVNDCSFEVKKGHIHSLIGPNGAGKTTLFNCINRMMGLDKGKIYFKGEDVTGKTPDKLAKMGIARTFQTIRLVDKLSVVENVMMGEYVNTKSNLITAGLYLPKSRREEREVKEKALKWLDFVDFDAEPDTPIDRLSYGQQRMLSIATAMVMNPDLILLDEPAAGLNTKESAKLSVLIQKIAGNGTSVLLVEHDMVLVMKISDIITAINFGVKLVDGTPEEIQKNPKVIEVYLGGS